jgi:asparagine synthase (glutamine-hydrolysing)
MCGIFAAVDLGGFFIDEDYNRFVQLADLIRYRGPDDCGYLRLNAKQRGHDSSALFDIFLANRRLSILDLSPAGHQPMTDGNGRWITFNGEIFNFVELRKELEAAGHEFQTGTDTEVILHVYDAYGVAGFSKLNGMWAFALVDLPQRMVVLSRDRFSIKPLYKYQSPDQRIYFASELKQLLPLLPRRTPNSDVIATFLTQGFVDYSRETFFSGIERIPAKTNLLMCMNTGMVVEQMYWDYREERPVHAVALEEEFRELLMDSTKIRLRSDVKVGVLLSGGLDSSTVAYCSHKLSGGSLETFSVVSEDKRYSEDQFIDAFSRETGIKNRKLVFKDSDVRQTLRQTLLHADEPFGSFSVVAQYRIFDLIKKETDVTVLMSGQGADEILLGYLKFFFFHVQELVRRRRYAKAIGELLCSFIRRTAVRHFRFGDAKRYIPFWNARKAFGYVRHEPKILTVWESTALRTRQIADIDCYSIPALTRYEDRNSMAHSLEVRHPFLDHRLVEFALNLPTELKLNGGWSKLILRESFPELPAQLRWRRDKQGFVTPEEAWLKHELQGLVKETFRKSLLADMGILDDHAFLSYYEAFRQGRPMTSYSEIARAVITEAWAKKYLS